jgi:hypothetical protein
MVDPTSEVLYLLGLLYVSWHLDVEFPHLLSRYKEIREEMALPDIGGKVFIDGSNYVQIHTACLVTANALKGLSF